MTSPISMASQMALSFVATETFSGKNAGFYFGRGSKGVGYYLDDKKENVKNSIAIEDQGKLGDLPNFKIAKFVLWVWIILLVIVGISLLLFPTVKKWDDEYMKSNELYTLIAKGLDDDIERYVVQGGSISLRSYLGLTPLHIAAAFGRTSVIKLLLGQSVDPQAELRKKVWYGASSVSMAAMLQQTKVINLLAYRKYELNERGWFGETALQWSVHSETTGTSRLDTMKALVNAGCDPRIGNWLRQTPLHFASRSGFLEETNFLIKVLAKKNSTANTPKGVPNSDSDNNNIDNNNGGSYYASSETINAIDATDWLGFSALHMAASNGHYNVVQKLVNAGNADVNIRSWYYGMTPLHEACEKGHTDIALLLLTKEADIHTLNWRRIAPLDMGAAQECKLDKKIAALLEKRVVSSHSENKHDQAGPDKEL